MADTRAFHLHELRIDPASGEITGDGPPRRLEPKPMAVLQTLVARPGEVVTRQELLDTVWPGVVVGDEAVTRCISELRDALGDTRGAPRFIRTLPKRGYVLLVSPQPTTTASATDTAPPSAGNDEVATTTAHRAPPRAVIALLALLCLAGPLTAWALSAGVLGQSHASERYDALAVGAFAGDNAATTAYGHGIAEQLANTLQALPNKRVHGPASVPELGFAPTDAERARAAIAAAERLGVNAVLLGRVERNQGRVALVIELRAGSDGSSLLSQEVEAPASDIFRLQDRLASEVARVLGASNNTPLRVARVSQDLASYELYLLGRHHWNRRTADALQRARGYFQQAVIADPNNARAWSGLADSYLLLAGNAVIPLAPARANAQDAINRALALAPNLAEAHASLGLMRYQREDLRGANAALTRATQLDPNYAMAWMWRAITSSSEGRLRDAHREVSRAVQLDPSHPTARANLLTVCIGLGRFDEAREQVAALERLQPEHPGYATFTFVLAEELGDIDAMARIAGHIRAAPDNRGQGEVLEARLAQARGELTLARVWADRAAERTNAEFGYEVALTALDLAAFAGDIAEVERRTLQTPPYLRGVDKPWPPSQMWLGIARVQRGDLAAAREPLLEAVDGLDAPYKDAVHSLTLYGFAARACSGDDSPRCAALRERLPVLIAELRAAGWNNRSFEQGAGLALAALGDAKGALQALQRAVRVGRVTRHDLVDDARLQPILAAREIAGLLATLPVVGA